MTFVTVRVELDVHEKLVLWTLGAVGHPVWRADLARLVPDVDLATVLPFLRRVGLLRGMSPAALSFEGTRQAARLVAAHEACRRRELRQLGVVEGTDELGAGA